MFKIWTVDTGIIFISLFFISTLEISLSRVTEYQSTPRNALATLGRLQNLEPARRVEVRNLDPDEMDRQIEHYLSIINHQNTKRPPEICLTRA